MDNCRQLVLAASRISNAMNESRREPCHGSVGISVACCGRAGWKMPTQLSPSMSGYQTVIWSAHECNSAFDPLASRKSTGLNSIPKDAAALWSAPVGRTPRVYWDFEEPPLVSRGAASRRKHRDQSRTNDWRTERDVP
jgi:hypothetical protein